MIELTVLDDNQVELNTLDDGWISLDVVMPTGGGGTPTLQTKSVSYTPTESEQSGTVLPDAGYDGLSEVDVTVGAIASDYVGSGITRRSSSDLTTVGSAVRVPSGYYSADAGKSIPNATISSVGATIGTNTTTHTATILPYAIVGSAGYIANGEYDGTSRTVTASQLVSGTKNITESGASIDVTNYASVNVPDAYLAEFDVEVAKNMATHSATVTPYFIAESSGFIGSDEYYGSSKTITASDLVSGTKNISANGTEDVTNYASVNVSVPQPSGTKNITISANGTTTEDVTNYASASITANVPNSYSASDEGKVVDNGALVAQTSDTVTQNDTYDTTLINSLTVNVSGGGGTAPLYPIGYNKSSNEYLEINGLSGHVKFERYTNNSSDYYISLGLIGIGTGSGVPNNKPVWFTISAGSTVVIKITNVVNSNGITWNMNFRKANATTSLGYGIGNGTHINGENISITATSNDEVGTLFLYVAHGIIGVLEFDVEITVDGVRYI